MAHTVQAHQYHRTTERL